MPPIRENNEHKYSRYTFQLAAYGCKSGAMVNCNPSRRAWRARASQTVFRSWGIQAVVMRRLGSRSRHISMQWCKNMWGGARTAGDAVDDVASAIGFPTSCRTTCAILQVPPHNGSACCCPALHKASVLQEHLAYLRAAPTKQNKTTTSATSS